MSAYHTIWSECPSRFNLLCSRASLKVQRLLWLGLPLWWDLGTNFLYHRLWWIYVIWRITSKKIILSYFSDSHIAEWVGNYSVLNYFLFLSDPHGLKCVPLHHIWYAEVLTATCNKESGWRVDIFPKILEVLFICWLYISRKFYVPHVRNRPACPKWVQRNANKKHLYVLYIVGMLEQDIATRQSSDCLQTIQLYTSHLLNL